MVIPMAKSKIAITLDGRLLDRLDRLVAKEAFGSRSHAIQVAVEEKLERLERSRLARECSKLDRGFKRASARRATSGPNTERRDSVGRPQPHSWARAGRPAACAGG